MVSADGRQRNQCNLSTVRKTRYLEQEVTGSLYHILVMLQMEHFMFILLGGTVVLLMLKGRDRRIWGWRRNTSRFMMTVFKYVEGSMSMAPQTDRFILPPSRRHARGVLGRADFESRAAHQWRIKQRLDGLLSGIL